MNKLAIENLSPTINITSDQSKRQTGSEQIARREFNAGQAPQEISEEKGVQTFSEMLKDSVGQVNELQKQADVAVREAVAGRNKNIHEVMLAVERADVSLKLMTQVRNKILDAYREIMRMQV